MNSQELAEIKRYMYNLDITLFQRAQRSYPRCEYLISTETKKVIEINSLLIKEVERLRHTTNTEELENAITEISKYEDTTGDIMDFIKSIRE